jgi:hypothetical protein
MPGTRPNWDVRRFSGNRWSIPAVLLKSPLDGGALRLISVNRAAYSLYLLFGPNTEPLYLYGSLADDACRLLQPPRQ